MSTRWVNQHPALVLRALDDCEIRGENVVHVDATSGGGVVFSTAVGLLEHLQWLGSRPPYDDGATHTVHLWCGHTYRAGLMYTTGDERLDGVPQVGNWSGCTVSGDWYPSQVVKVVKESGW